MELNGKRVLITGGAGMVGSHLAERLANRNDVIVVDDLSSGRVKWLPEDAEFIEADLTDSATVNEVIRDDIDVVFHFAASKHVNTDAPRIQFEDNSAMAYNVLQAMADVGVNKIAFTSSSTVYGEAPRPTPEEFGPLEPISPYAVSKLAAEGLLSTYAYSHGFTVWNYRFANIVGTRLVGAVIPDFIEKLRRDPSTLSILGDGHQEKSYMHIEECIEAMTYVVEQTDDPMNTYNIGTRTTTSVQTIADIVSEEMGLNPDYEFTGGDRGWSGDVPKMRLSIQKLTKLGWEPNQSSTEAVRQATREILERRRESE